MTAYKVAIDQTMRTIDRRAKYYRNLIVAVVLISLISVSLTMCVWALLPLAGFFFLLPVCGLYFVLDSRFLNHWRSQLLKSWAKREIDFRAFSDAVSAIPKLPKGTVQGMLATLPSLGDLITEQGISPSTREAITALLTTIYTCRSDAIMFKAAIYTILGGSLTASIALWMWKPLLGILILILILFLQKWVKTCRLKDMREKTISAQKLPDFNLEKYLSFAKHLNWSPISDSEKDNFLAAVCTTE